MGQLIIGVEGYKKLQLGYELNSNDAKVKNFRVAALPTGIDGIAPGDLLVTTAKSQNYSVTDPSAAAATYTGKIAGILLATNVKVDTVFPQSSGEVLFKTGESGGCLVRGEIAVKLYGAAPAENDAVYYNLAQKAFTKTSTNNLSVPNAKFSGITEGNLTVVNLLY